LERPLCAKKPTLQEWRLFALAISGGQPLRGSHVKADPRKVHVHFADRGIFVPDDDFICRPCEYGAMMYGPAALYETQFQERRT
jgi:hypothetical protein